MKDVISGKKDAQPNGNAFSDGIIEFRFKTSPGNFAPVVNEEEAIENLVCP